MYLIKVISNDRKSKVFVQVTQLTDLIAEGCRKLKLPDDSYQVYQEDDGTLIDDDGVLEALCDEANTRHQKLSVLLLPEDLNWATVNAIQRSSPTRHGSSPIRRSVSESSSESGQSSESSSLNLDPNLLNSSQCVTRGFPISTVSQFLDPVIEILKSSTQPPRHFPHLRKHAIKETFHAIGNYMILKLKDFSKDTARRLARSVLDFGDKKYAMIFAIVIGEEEADSGHAAFAQQIYAYVQAHKGEANKRKQGSRKRGHENEEENPDDVRPPPRSKQDSYGCVAFEPPLPEHETAASQEAKRVGAASVNPLSDEATELMKITYASQRMEINRGKPMLTNLPKILDRWPLLTRKVFLIEHAAILLGKDVSTVWVQSVSKKWESVLRYLKSYWQSPKTVNKELLEIINEVEQTDTAARSVVARCSSIFFLIVGYMGEEFSALFATVSALSSDEDLLEAAAEAEGYPLVVVKGDSLIDTDAEFYVVLVGKIVVRVGDATEAVLLLLLSYYNFNLCYRPNLHSSLEFFQRFFLDVNPSPNNGSKRSKQKRTVDHVDAKVKALASKLKEHSSLWTVPSQ